LHEETIVEAKLNTIGAHELPKNRIVAIPLLVSFLVLMLFVGIPNSCNDLSQVDSIDSESPTRFAHITDTQTGILDSVSIEHTGSSTGMTQLGSARTDVDPYPSSEVYLPVGSSGNYYSGDCDSGGYFLAGAGGSADFGSPAGTISFWGKWDLTAPHGRFWGQHADFETRWASNRLVLDWGADGSIQGLKSDWEIDHWYFIAITWDETANLIAIYWGDETTSPTLDIVSAWTSSTVGFHTENNIMNSIGRSTSQVDGHVDDFRYYSKQRNITEIQEDYLPASTIIDPSLEAYYRFENDLTDSVGDQDLHTVGECTISRDVPRTPHGWYGNQIKVTASEVRKLYALNGTFESGTPGTNEDWTGDGLYFADGWLAQRENLNPSGKQRASYVEDVDSYVLVENEGYYTGTTYTHYNGTRIFWYQDIDNSEQNELFHFSLDYNYIRGPLGTNFADIFELQFEILDGVKSLWNWSIDLTNVTQRQTWFNTNQMLVNITGAPSSFTARAMLSVDMISSSVAISETDADLDGDSSNGQFVTVHLNNLELVSAETLSCPQVELAVSSVETGSIEISDSGIALLNNTDWTDSITPLNFSSNTSIVFDFSAEFSRMHRHYNSSFTTNLDNIGTSYSVDLGTKVNLTLYTYVQSTPEATDLGFIIYCPRDWENATVEDPFGAIVTTTENGFIEVPNGEVDSVGWWKVSLEAPNYARTVTTQLPDESGLNWEDNLIFFNENKIRCSALIGTATSIVSSVNDIEIIWYLPSDSIWSSEILSNSSGNLITSNQLSLDSSNTTTGEWLVSVTWNNGTEVAYGYCHFELHHQLHMIAQTPHIDAELEENFTAAIYLYDQDTGSPILSDATIVGNWSTYDISFNPNLAKGWWEADFNSSIMGTGGYSILINATMPFFSVTSYTMSLEITTVTIMTILGTQYVEIDPDDSYNVTIRYMFLDGAGIDEANISILSYSGPSGGLQYEDPQVIFGEPGNYSIEFTASLSGTYFITLTATKSHHNLAATSFYIIVGAVPAEIEMYQSDIPDVLYYNQTYSCSLQYRSEDLSGINGAIVNITYNPVSIVEWEEIGDGIYNISIRVSDVGSYAVYLRFSKIGFNYADISFSFEVIEIPTSITFYGLQTEYYEGQTYGFSVYFNSSLENGVEDAELIPSVAIQDFFEYSSSEAGWYNFTLSPEVGNWNVTIWLTKDGFEDQDYRFTLSTELRPIDISPAYQLNSTYTRYADSVLTIIILPISGDTDTAIQSADIVYILIDTIGERTIAQGHLIETSGIYTVNITIPEVGLYLLRITISKEHHETLTREIVLSSIVRPDSLYASYLNAGVIGALFLFCCFASVMVGRRFYTSTITKRNLVLSELKGRLEDARNLIGLLVIQRKNGLPIYSRILKGGFQESLLSAFITAVSNFREEISMDSAKWTAIPISEVVTAVQTEELICVIITVETASVTQTTQLEIFSREMGGLYDHDDKFVSPVLRKLNSEEMTTFGESFDSHFDGAMFLRYVGVKKTLPGHLSKISSIFKTMSINHGVTIEVIIKSLVSQGMNERTAYKIAMEAMDGGYLIALEKRLPSPDELDEETSF